MKSPKIFGDFVLYLLTPEPMYDIINITSRNHKAVKKNVKKDLTSDTTYDIIYL